MAAKSHVELDFLGLQNLPNSVAQPQPQPRLDRRESFRGISKINPEIVKSVFASASKHGASENASKWMSPPMSPSLGITELPIFQQVPLISEPSCKEKATETAPLTIFYNGTISVYDMSKDEAEHIMKLALEKNISINDGKLVDHSSYNSGAPDEILKPLNDEDGDMPLKRKISLQRFFEKRKERLMTVAPYPLMGNNHVASIEKKKI